MVSQKMNGGRIYLLVRFSLLCGGDRCCGIAQVGRPAAARCWQFSAVVVKIHGARNVACPPTVLSQNYVPVRTFRNERRENLSSDIRNWSVLRLLLVIPWPPTTHHTNIHLCSQTMGRGCTGSSSDWYVRDATHTHCLGRQEERRTIIFPDDES